MLRFIALLSACGSAVLFRLNVAVRIRICRTSEQHLASCQKEGTVRIIFLCISPIYISTVFFAEKTAL